MTIAVQSQGHEYDFGRLCPDDVPPNPDWNPDTVERPEAPEDNAEPEPPPQMQARSADELARLLEGEDLSGPAGAFRSIGANGAHGLAWQN